MRHVGSPRGKSLTVTRKPRGPKKPRVTFKARLEQYLEARQQGLNASDAGQVLMDSGATLGMVLRVKKACGDAR